MKRLVWLLPLVTLLGCASAPPPEPDHPATPGPARAEPNSAPTGASCGNRPGAAVESMMALCRRVEITPPAGWRQLTGIYSGRSCEFLFGHFDPQDGQLQVSIIRDAATTSSQVCEHEAAGYRGDGAQVPIVRHFDGDAAGTCRFDWTNPMANRAGTVRVYNLDASGDPPVIVKLASTGFAANDQRLAEYVDRWSQAIKLPAAE